MTYVVTLGMEIEFYLPDPPPYTPMDLVNMGFHRDYNKTYEVSLPPTELDRYEELAWRYVKAKKLIESIGGVLCAEYEEMDNRWTNGSHIHIRIEPENPVLWARSLNWSSILTAVLAPLFASCIKAYRIGNEILIHEYCSERTYAFRFKIRYFAEPPPRVSWRTMKLILERGRRFRSLYPVSDVNDFFAVEVNRYRKDVATIEIRTNEMGWKTAVAIADLINMLATINTPRVSTITLYDDFVKHYQLPVRIKSTIEFDHQILKGYVSPVKAAQQLLEYADRIGYRLKPPTKKLLTILATEERRPLFEETI